MAPSPTSPTSGCRRTAVAPVWTQAASLPGVGAYADCAMVALFDAAPPSTPYSTVIMAPSTSTSVWASTNLGQSWQAVGTQPWYPSRQNNQLTADADNYMYATGGYADGRLYFSWDKGVTWTVIEQSSNSAFANPATYASSTRSCQSLRYVAATTASVASHPQLVYLRQWGGHYDLPQRSSGDCTRTGVEVVYGDVVFPTTVSGGGSGVSGTGYMCMMFYGLPGNVDYPWSVATSLTFQYTTLSSGAVSITSGSGTRGYHGPLRHFHVPRPSQWARRALAGPTTCCTWARLPPSTPTGWH